MRIIDADAMRQGWLENGENEYKYDTNAVLDNIDQQPTIDLESLRSVGNWIEDEYGFNRCSVCGWEWDTPEYTTPFCPNCGEKMDAEEENYEPSQE